MDYSYADFFVGNFFEGLANCFDRTLNVRFDDDGKFLDFALCNLVEEVIKSNFLILFECFLFCFIFTLFNKFACKFFIRNSVELIAAGGNGIKTGDFNRNGRTCFGDSVAFVVDHNTDFTDRGACNDNIAGMKSTVLNKHGSNGAAAFIESGFDNGTFCHSVGVCFKLANFRNKGDHFKKSIDIFTGFCGNGNADNVAAPFFRNKTVFGKALHNFIRVCGGFIDFVDCNDDGNFRSFCVVDSFNGLGHNAVIRRNNKDCNIGAKCAAGTHCGECFMSGGIEEGDGASAFGGYSVCTKVLGNAACFAGSNVCASDIVKDGSLAVVNVTHYANNRIAGDEICCIVLAVVNKAVFDGYNNFFFNFCADIHCNKSCSIIIDNFVYGNHHTLEHKALDNFGRGDFELESKVADGDFIGNGDFKFLAALTLHFELFEFFLFLLMFALLGFALLFALLVKLLLIGVAVAHGRSGSNLFIFIVIFIKVNGNRAHINMGNACCKFFCRGLICGAGFAFNGFLRFMAMAVILFILIEAEVVSAEAVIFIEVRFIAEFAFAVLGTVAVEFTFAVLGAVAVKFAFTVLGTVAIKFTFAVLGAVAVKFAFAVLGAVAVKFTFAVLGAVAVEFAFAVLRTVIIEFALAVLGFFGTLVVSAFALTVFCGFSFVIFLFGFLNRFFSRLFFRFGCGFLFRFLFFFYRGFFCLRCGGSFFLRFAGRFFCRFFFCFGCGFFRFLFGFGLTGHCEIRSKACYFVFFGVMFKNEVKLLFGKCGLSLFCGEFFAENVKNVFYRFFKVFCDIRHFIFNIFNHLCNSSKIVHALCAVIPTALLSFLKNRCRKRQAHRHVLQRHNQFHPLKGAKSKFLFRFLRQCVLCFLPFFRNNRLKGEPNRPFPSAWLQPSYRSRR